MPDPPGIPSWKGRVAGPSRRARFALAFVREGSGPVRAIAPVREGGLRPSQGGVANSRSSPCHRSEEHTSELQSLMRISYAVFCLKKKIQSLNSLHSHNHVP